MRLGHGAGRRGQPERPVVGLPVVVAGQPEAQRDDEDVERLATRIQDVVIDQSKRRTLYNYTHPADTLSRNETGAQLTAEWPQRTPAAPCETAAELQTSPYVNSSCN